MGSDTPARGKLQDGFSRLSDAGESMPSTEQMALSMSMSCLLQRVSIQKLFVTVSDD